MPAAVRQAERALLERETTKTYVGPAGNPGFNQAMERLVLGAGHPALAAGRVRSVQTPGGCGALRLGAELIRAASPESVGAREHADLGESRAAARRGGLEARALSVLRSPAPAACSSMRMLAALEKLPPRAVVLLHASCHNPTGADLSQDQWRAVLAVVQAPAAAAVHRHGVPGPGRWAWRRTPLRSRLFCAELPEVMCAVSCSKNFGLYRERTGALHVSCSTPAAADAVIEPAGAPRRAACGRCRPITARPSCTASSPTPALRAAVEGRARRHARSASRACATRSCEQLRRHCPQRDFGFIAAQRGMFSFFGISTAQVRALRDAPPHLHDRRQPHEHRGAAPGEPRVLRARRGAGARIRAARLRRRGVELNSRDAHRWRRNRDGSGHRRRTRARVFARAAARGDAAPGGRCLRRGARRSRAGARGRARGARSRARRALGGGGARRQALASAGRAHARAVPARQRAGQGAHGPGGGAAAHPRPEARRPADRRAPRHDAQRGRAG